MVFFKKLFRAGEIHSRFLYYRVMPSTPSWWAVCSMWLPGPSSSSEPPLNSWCFQSLHGTNRCPYQCSVYIYKNIYPCPYVYIYYTHKTNMHMSITDSLMKYKPRKYLKIWTRNMEKNRDSQFIQTLKVLDTFRLLESKHRCKLGWRLLHWHPLPVTIGNTYTCASEVKTCQNIH